MEMIAAALLASVTLTSRYFVVEGVAETITLWLSAFVLSLTVLAWIQDKLEGIYEKRRSKKVVDYKIREVWENPKYLEHQRRSREESERGEW